MKKGLVLFVLAMILVPWGLYFKESRSYAILNCRWEGWLENAGRFRFPEE